MNAFLKTALFRKTCFLRVELNFCRILLWLSRKFLILKHDCWFFSDFNGHRVGILNVNTQVIEVCFYGYEGSAPGLFNRPQGVCLDREKNLVIADARNGRIQVRLSVVEFKAYFMFRFLILATCVFLPFLMLSVCSIARVTFALVWMAAFTLWTSETTAFAFYNFTRF